MANFSARNKTLTAKLLQQGYRYLGKLFSKVYRRHYEFVFKYRDQNSVVTKCISLEKLWENLNILIISVKLSYVINERGHLCHKTDCLLMYFCIKSNIGTQGEVG